MSGHKPSLRSLSPEFITAQHGEYVQLLVQELQRTGPDAPRNIALTGHYGSGKSSVLVETQRRLEADAERVINLSLPSLGIGDARVEASDGPLGTTTNLIQKEIVKQLLYRRKPSATPASRYNRLDIFHKRPAYLRAAGAGLGFAGLALLAKLPDEVEAALPSGFWSALNNNIWNHLTTTLQWASLLVVLDSRLARWSGLSGSSSSGSD